MTEVLASPLIVQAVLWSCLASVAAVFVWHRL